MFTRAAQDRGDPEQQRRENDKACGRDSCINPALETFGQQRFDVDYRAGLIAVITHPGDTAIRPAEAAVTSPEMR
jgi:hypothetical protein